MVFAKRDLFGRAVTFCRNQFDCPLKLQLTQRLSEVTKLFELRLLTRRGASRADRVVDFVHVLDGRAKDPFPTPPRPRQEFQRFQIDRSEEASLERLTPSRNVADRRTFGASNGAGKHT